MPGSKLQRHEGSASMVPMINVDFTLSRHLRELFVHFCLRELFRPFLSSRAVSSISELAQTVQKVPSDQPISTLQAAVMAACCATFHHLLKLYIMIR